MIGYFIATIFDNYYKRNDMLYKYKTGEVYEHNIIFYEIIYDCKNLLGYGNRYFVIEPLGKVKHDIDNHSTTTNKFKIIKEIQTMIMQLYYNYDGDNNNHILLKPNEGKNIKDSGDIFYYKKGIIHRDDGFPAIIRKNGSEEYIVDGKYNREGDLPAKVIYKGDKCILKEWQMNGLYNRANKLPAIIIYNEYGNIIEEQYYINGKLHREDNLPAIIKWNNVGKIIEEYYYINNNFNRIDNLPAHVKYDDKGNIIEYHYYNQYGCYKYMKNYDQEIIYFEKNEKGNMTVHRDDGLPAVINKNGSKEYIVKGFKHRDGDLPAIIKCNNNGKIIEEHYYKNNRLNRDNKLPAIIIYDEYGNILKKRFFINGIEQ
jgi:hypothetical protein